MRLKFVSWDTFRSLSMSEQRRPDLPEMKASSRVSIGNIDSVSQELSLYGSKIEDTRIDTVLFLLI